MYKFRFIAFFRFILLVFLLFSWNINADAAKWQWSVTLNHTVSKETNAHPTAFLWIPPNCKQVRGVIVGQHNMLEEGILEHQKFRKTLSDLGFAEIWITPGLDMIFDFHEDAESDFKEMLKNLGEISGYQELEFAPVVPIGHSAAASYPWNFAAFNPDRTLAILSIHGDAPLTNLTGSGRPNPDWGSKNINGIPGLMVMGEYEWGEDRILPALQFKKKYPECPVAFLADAGHGHFDFSDELIDFLSMFIRKCARERLPEVMPLNAPVSLKPIHPKEGWLVDRWRKNDPLQAPPGSYQQYKGNKAEAFWAFDQEMAKATAQYYNRSRAKIPQYIGYVQNGKLLPGAGSFIGYRPLFIPEKDGLTFHLSAAFIDALQGKTPTQNHVNGKINITRICGPVQKINDTTFSVRFYRMGFNNQKRTGDIWLMASNSGDKKYKSVVQQANLKIPVRNEEGNEQKIDFLPIPPQTAGLKSLALSATSSAGVPIYYYVKEGPAEIEGNTLKFTRIPVRAKFPVKVTVVAWQWGRNTEPKLKSAVPVERSFNIVEF